MGVQILLVWSFFVHKNASLYILALLNIDKTHRCQKHLSKVSGLDVVNQKVSAF